MPKPWETFLRDIRQVVSGDSTPEMSDGELRDRVVRYRDSAAFAALMEVVARSPDLKLWPGLPTVPRAPTVGLPAVPHASPRHGRPHPKRPFSARLMDEQLSGGRLRIMK